MRLHVLALLLALCARSALAQTGSYGAPETKSPAITEPQDISSVPDNQSWLGAWMGYNVGTTDKPVLKPWDASQDLPIQPNQHLKGFGPKMCGLISMCASNDQYYDFSTKSIKPTYPPSTTCKTCKDTARNLFIIHVVYWHTATTAATSPIWYQSSTWYFYKSDAKGNYKSLQPKLSKDGSSFTLPDIYDVDNGFIISVSRLATTAAQPSLLSPNINYTPTITLVTPTWLAGLETIASSFSGVSLGGTSGSKASFGVVTANYNARIKVVQLSPSNIRRPFTLSIAATASGQNGNTLDCTSLGSASSCSFQTSATVLARDFVAFGVGIVPHGPRETTWATNTTTNMLTPTTSNHNNFYGLVDFAPWPARFPMSRWPYFQAGLPLTGAATHLPYAGMGMPFPWFRKELAVSLFGGFVIMQQQDPAGTRDRAIKGLWGVEVPIASLASQISKVTGNASKKGGS